MVNINTSLNAQQRGWGPGWPTSRYDDMTAINVKGVSFPGGVHKVLAPLVVVLLEECDRRGYPLVRGWCWGYANRAIKDDDGDLGDDPSNHSWGLAIDVNAPANPYGGWSYDIPEWMVDLFESYGFRWGGRYTDYMHFEFMGTPDDAREMFDKAINELGEDEDEMAFADFRAGIEAYQAGKGIKAEWNGDKKFGWRFARYAANNPRVEA